MNPLPKMSYSAALMNSSYKAPSTSSSTVKQIKTCKQEQKISTTPKQKVYKDLTAVICSDCNINCAAIPKDWRGVVHCTFIKKPYSIEFIVGKTGHKTIISGNGEYNVKFNGKDIVYTRQKHECVDTYRHDTYDLSELIEDHQHDLFMAELASLTARVGNLCDHMRKSTT